MAEERKDSNSALVIDNPHVAWAPESDHRKVSLIVYTTPAELRMIAGMLEERDEVRINWYHTRYLFRNEARTSTGASPGTTP